jgi:dCMP deaminase
MRWDEYFLNMLPAIASKSPDPRTKVGAVIVDDRNIIIGTGYNGLPRGVKHEAERFEAPEKYDWMLHAEENAILCARRSVEKGVLYVSRFPCHYCARRIIQAGISRVVVGEQTDKDFAVRWADSHEKSKAMFREAGVDFGEDLCKCVGLRTLVCTDEGLDCYQCGERTVERGA